MLMSKVRRESAKRLQTFLAFEEVRTISSLQNIPQFNQNYDKLHRRSTFSARNMSTIKSPKPKVDSTSSSSKGGASQSPVNLAYISYERKDSDGKSPLVIQHGLFGCKENWKNVSKEINFMSKRSVFSMDARNHGESPHSSEMSLGLMARDIHQFVDQIGFNKISFMGHGFGGRIGMMLSMMYPQILDRLVVVDTTPLMVQDTALRYSLILKATAVLKNMEPELRQCQGYKCGLQAEKAIEHILKDKRDIAVVLSNLRAPNTTVSKNREVTTNGVKTDPNSLWRVNLDSILSNPCLTDFPELDDGVAYEGKTLFIQGKRSHYLRQSDEPKIKRLFPNAEFVWFEGAGHWIHLEKHTEFMQVVLQFLDKKKQ